MISRDQCRSVKGDLRKMFNVVGTFVLRAEDFQRALKKSTVLPCRRTRMNNKTTKNGRLLEFGYKLKSVSIV